MDEDKNHTSLLSNFKSYNDCDGVPYN